MTLLSLIKLVHLLGLIMGFGGAILADILILRGAILNPIENKTIQAVRSLSHIVFIGLALLWLSGIILVGIRVSADPNVWMNQKIWAKVIIVSILTVNGIFVHNIALRRLVTRHSQKMFSISRPYELAGLSLVAAISSVSWIVPFVLGVATEFNFTVRAVGILAVYTILILAGWATFFAIAYMSARIDRVQKLRARQGGSQLHNGYQQSHYRVIPESLSLQFRSELDYFKQRIRDHDAQWAEFRNDLKQSVANFDQSIDDMNVPAAEPDWREIGIHELGISGAHVEVPSLPMKQTMRQPDFHRNTYRSPAAA
jgi:hypothetical protein